MAMPTGWACLAWWRDRCLEWCYDKPGRGSPSSPTRNISIVFEQMFPRAVLITRSSGRQPGGPGILPAHKLEARNGRLLVDGGAADIFFSLSTSFRRLATVFCGTPTTGPIGAKRRPFLDDLFVPALPSMLCRWRICSEIRWASRRGKAAHGAIFFFVPGGIPQDRAVAVWVATPVNRLGEDAVQSFTVFTICATSSSLRKRMHGQGSEPSPSGFFSVFLQDPDGARAMRPV